MGCGEESSHGGKPYPRLKRRSTAKAREMNSRLSQRHGDTEEENGNRVGKSCENIQSAFTEAERREKQEWQQD